MQPDLLKRLLSLNKSPFMHKLFYLFAALTLFSACACNNPAPHTKSFVDITGIDPSIKPGDNFFRYVNGRWYDTATIAADQAGAIWAKPWASCTYGAILTKLQKGACSTS